MTILVEISSEAEARLAAEAKSLGLALEEHASKILEQSSEQQETGTGRLTRESLHAMTKRLQQGMEKLPILPPEATERASLYEDRW